MTTSRPRCQDRSSTLSSAPRLAGAPSTVLSQLVPPPPIRRLPESARPSQTVGTWRNGIGAGGRPPQEVEGAHTEGSATVAEGEDISRADPRELTGPLAPFGSRAVGFLIDCVIPVIVLNLLLSIVAISGGA